MSLQLHEPSVPTMPPPRIFFSISHYKEQMETVTDSLAGAPRPFIGYYCRLEVTYPDGCNKPALSQMVLRRWSHFVWFEREWGRVYPSLQAEYHLPTKITFTSVFNKTRLADSRKLVLQQYIQKLLTINCLQEFVAQFLEVDFDVFNSRSSRDGETNGGTSVRSPSPAPSPPLGSSNGANGNGVPPPPPAPPALRVLNSGYVREGPEQKGNTDEASRKAHRDKRKFEQANKALLDAILAAKAGGAAAPSVKLNLPFVSGAGGGSGSGFNPSDVSAAVMANSLSPEGSRSSSPMPQSWGSSPGANGHAAASASPVFISSSPGLNGSSVGSPPALGLSALPPPPPRSAVLESMRGRNSLISGGSALATAAIAVPPPTPTRGLISASLLAAAGNRSRPSPPPSPSPPALVAPNASAAAVPPVPASRPQMAQIAKPVSSKPPPPVPSTRPGGAAPPVSSLLASRVAAFSAGSGAAASPTPISVVIPPKLSHPPPLTPGSAGSSASPRPPPPPPPVPSRSSDSRTPPPPPPPAAPVASPAVAAVDGTAVRKSKFCSECGTRAGDGKFCSGCGHSLLTRL